jgi:hypothetical protein
LNKVIGMANKAVRQAVREAFFDAPAARDARPRLKLHDGRGAGGIATVLHCLHRDTVIEPLPSEFVALLKQIDLADRRR